MAFTAYPNIPSLKSLSQPDRQELERWWSDFTRELDDRDSKSHLGPTSNNVWVLTSTSTTYSFDPVSASTTTTNVVLFTLLQELKQKGIIL